MHEEEDARAYILSQILDPPGEIALGILYSDLTACLMKASTTISQALTMMRCAEGIWGCTGFSPLRWEKGSETPS